MQAITLENWERRELFDYYSQMSNPIFMVSFRQDVTNLYRYVKARGLSFYKGLIWACTQAINDVDDFRVVMRDGKPVLLERRDPSFTDLRPGSEQFYIVTLKHLPDIDDFCHEAERISDAQDDFIDEDKESDSLIYYTSVPWIDLTGLTNPRDLSTAEARADSIPRLAWGKFTESNGRRILGMSMECNHCFVDGVHVGQFARRLSYYIESLEP